MKKASCSLNYKTPSPQNLNTSCDENFPSQLKRCHEKFAEASNESRDSDSLGFYLSHHQQESQETDIFIEVKS